MKAHIIKAHSFHLSDALGSGYEMLSVSFWTQATVLTSVCVKCKDYKAGEPLSN